MKAIINLVEKRVTLIYSIKKLASNIVFDNYINYELIEKNSKIICSHDILFDEIDEWETIMLFDGRIVDFHFNYINSSEFEDINSWRKNLLQGYLYTEGEEQDYQNAIDIKIKTTY